MADPGSVKGVYRMPDGQVRTSRTVMQVIEADIISGNYSRRRALPNSRGVVPAVSFGRR
jgi:hypothetical protein